MKQWEVLKTVFPELITDNFEFIDYKESDTILEYWFDEREYMSREDYKRGCVRPYGFTECRTIQDFPKVLRGSQLTMGQMVNSYPPNTKRSFRIIAIGNNWITRLSICCFLKIWETISVQMRLV